MPKATIWNPEWDQFRLTEYDKEVVDGLKEVQDLVRGREAIIQSYETTDQKVLATERAIEGLYQDRIGTQRARMSVSDFLREAVEDALNGVKSGVKSDVKSDLTPLSDQLKTKDTQIERLMCQLEDANRRHDDTQRAAESASQRHDTIVLQMTTQLDRTMLQLEDSRNREKQNWWSRMFSRNGGPSESISAESQS